MRATTLLNTLLGIKFTRVTSVEFTEDGLVCDVAPTTAIPRCGGCCRRVAQVHDRREPRRWRHLDLAGMRLELRYAPRRVRCPRCGVTVDGQLDPEKSAQRGVGREVAAAPDVS